MQRPYLALAAAAFAVLAAPPAHAQFYDLDGAYRCLTTPDDSCQQAQRERPPEPPQKPAPPSLNEIIARVRAKTLDARDLETLQKDAAANEPRAVEVLAWCKLNGIGGPADAKAAFWLYRQAAALGVANARRNQIAIYETRLTPDERQEVLLRENAR
jgi:TPR repeat protein